MKLNIEVKNTEIMFESYKETDIKRIVISVSIDDYKFKITIFYEEVRYNGDRFFAYVEIEDNEGNYFQYDVISFWDTIFFDFLSLHYKNEISDENFRKKLEKISKKILDKETKIIKDNYIEY